ncbi:MAG TPA: cutinase family protein [Lacisediminihabitans sp.]|jgi:hypothetical protein|nr:cutinase family protein [Lacisediminihabitans sp.]HXD61545.1 cutinase family protein [Lacisediminihabitans sp.]
MISIRGTGEAAGSGTAHGGRTYASGGAGATLNNLIGYANREPNIPFYQEAINYPAVALDVNNPQAKDYLASLQYGATNLANEINDLVANCPYTNILLAGYSQGADVIGQVIGAYRSTSITVPALRPGSFQQLKSVMLFGDPHYRPGEVWDAAGNGTANGVFVSPAGQFQYAKRLTWLPPSYQVQGYVTTVRSYCFAGDFFCQSTFTAAGLTVHGSYGASSAMGDAWSFTLNALIDFE